MKEELDSLIGKQVCVNVIIADPEIAMEFVGVLTPDDGYGDCRVSNDKGSWITFKSTTTKITQTPNGNSKAIIFI